MTGYFILIPFFLIISIQHMRNKNIVPLLLFYTLISPSVTVTSNLRIDSAYFLLLGLMFVILITKKTLTLSMELKKFFVFTLALCMIFLLSWIINSRTDMNTLIIGIVGFIKVPLILVVLDNMGAHKSDALSDIIAVIRSITIVNFAAILLQRLLPVFSYELFSGLYASNTSTYYSQSTSEWGTGGFYNGRYIRMFGVFENPMLMGGVVALALAFYVSLYFSGKKLSILDKINIPILIYSGLVSSTKTFMLSLPLLCLIMAGLLFVSKDDTIKNKRKRKLVFFLIFPIAILLIVIFYDRIYEWLYSFSPTIANYFSYLSDPLAAFSTRFGSSSDTGLLAPTVTVIKNNLLLGVGPSSVYGEPIGDSSYVVLMHHGGLVALFVFLIYYISILIDKFRRQDVEAVTVLLLLLCIGSGLNIVLGANVTVFVYYYLLKNNGYMANQYLNGKERVAYAQCMKNC